MRGVLVIGLLAGAAGAAGSGGCLMSGNYHSAKTLGKGESQVGMTFSATRYEKETTDSNGNPVVAAAVIPNVIPEITYHIGMTDNLEAGGRASLGALGLEGDVKYRFFRNEKLHLAIAPAVSYQAFVILQGVGFRLPGILTYELADNFDFTAAVYGSTTRYTVPTSISDSDFGKFQGTLVSTGGALGFDLHGETFSIRPSVEFTRYVANLSAGDSMDSTGFNTVNFLVHISWTLGKEKKQLDRIERKIDNLTAPPPPPPPSSPMAPSPEPPPGPPPPPPGE